jgi:glycosyltransferase involved in cell wall biosynthesis
MRVHESISVAMCTYNGEPYLREQLDSIAKQTVLPLELVICDDGSVDSTTDIVTEFASSAPFSVKLITNPNNLGSTKNFEQVIGLCSGELIALCDQDDIWRPEKMSVQAARFECDPSLGGLFSNALLVDSESSPTGRTLWRSIDFGPARQRQVQSGQAASVLLSRSVVTGATLMFRAELVPEVRPIPSSWTHDGWIAWVIALNSKIDLIPECLSYYRVHSFQQCGVLPPPLQRIRKERQAASSAHLAVVRQLQDLCRYLDDGPSSAQSLWGPLIQRKIQHLRVRAGLPSNRLLRFVRLLPEFQNYRRFSKGWNSLLKDIVI